jgi:hypothetical protein
VSTGAFNWKRDTLTIVDPQLSGPFSASATMTGPTTTVTARGHKYSFTPFAGP